MNVEQLVERLAEIPGYYPVTVEVIVGGDLVRDHIDLEQVVVADRATVVLQPEPDEYDIRALIDEALEAREAEEERQVLEAAGWLKDPTADLEQVRAAVVADDGLRERVEAAVAQGLYERLMEATQDHWRQWYFLKDERKEAYRAEAAEIIAAALDATPAFTEDRADNEDQA